MRCDEIEIGRVLTFTPDGDLDHEGAPALLALIDRALVKAQKCILLDLSRATCADSVGLEILVSAARRVVAAGGRFGLCGVGETMAKILAATRLDRRFEISASREQALQSLRSEI
jgi:anti-anti-sigma factor